MTARYAKVVVAALTIIAFPTIAAIAREQCEMVFTVCPREFNGDTIRVPEKVVAMGPRVYSCEGIYAAGLDTIAPSIMFVIDNSGSMSGLGNDTTDRMGSRFTVPLALLDEFFTRWPNAEVGVAVFQNLLYFDHRDDPFFTALPGNVDGIAHQSYIPLTRLNRQLPGGKLGIQKLKEVLAIDTARALLYGGRVNDYVRLKYVPGDTSRLNINTNINVGFEAAKHAFLSAAAPRERQVIIFLSDGEPFGRFQAGKEPLYFMQGVDVPTTFTVYFTSNNTAPQSIITMTENIRTNGYSTTNPRSQLWAMQTSRDALLSLIMRNIIDAVFMGKPQSMTISSPSGTSTSTSLQGSSFVFPRPFSLQPTLTTFDLSLVFRATDKVAGTARDTTITATFHVKRDPSAPLAPPPGIDFVCRVPDTIVIPVVATLRDTSGDGHIDRVVLTWTDTATIRAQMPEVRQFIRTLNLTLPDGSPVSLTAVSLIPDLKNNTIHVIVRENTGPKLETGWQKADVALHPIPMGTGGEILRVVRVVDEAGPSVSRALLVPRSEPGGFDSIRVFFSETIRCRTLTGAPPPPMRSYIWMTGWQARKHYAVPCTRYNAQPLTSPKL